MLGVFHATFVVARMMSVLRRLRDEGANPLYGQRFASIAEKFEIGRASMEEGGEFTRLGQRIVSSLPLVAYGEAS